MLFGRHKRKLKRVLIVEDEPLVAFDNEHFLSGAGFEVVATVDGAADAVAIIEAGGADLILTDIRLEGDGSGIDVARAAQHQGLTVLFVTGDCPPEAKEFAIGCLAKPYGPGALLKAIDIVEAKVGGRQVRRLPSGLTLFGD